MCSSINCEIHVWCRHDKHRSFFLPFTLSLCILKTVAPMIEAMVRKQRPAILSHTVIPIHQLTQILIYTFNCG